MAAAASSAVAAAAASTASTTTPAITSAAPKFKLLDPTIAVTLKPVRYPAPQGKQIQGKLRHPKSQAARNWQRAESQRVKKALQSLTHGKNIFAYHNLRTNQVVYSLSRTLNLSLSHQHHQQRQSVLSQLIYHGKKTVPATLRKDVWIPYFSVHFPSPEPGLRAYKMLREFSLRRQLEPPAEMITHTDETIEKKKPRDPNQLEKWEKEWKPRVGQFMQKKERARILMDQKATSVADLAFVLTFLHKERLQNEQLAAQAEQEDGAAAAEEQGENGEKGKKTKKLSIKARKRQRRARAREELRRKRIEERIAQLEKEIWEREHVRVKITDEVEMTGHKLNEGEVKILWTDIQDAHYAREWPDSSIHDELAPTKEHIISHKVKARQPVEVSRSEESETQEAAESQPAEQQPAVQEKKKSGLDRLKFWQK
ncbi:hypothetical protein VTO42DRAFT_5287 [Malbranchea cinnamomea]